MGFKKIFLVNDGGQSDYISDVIRKFEIDRIELFCTKEINFFPELFGLNSNVQFKSNMDIRKRIYVHNILDKLEKIYRDGYIICLDADERLELPGDCQSICDHSFFRERKDGFLRIWVAECVSYSKSGISGNVFRYYPRWLRYLIKASRFIGRKIPFDFTEDLLGYIVARVFSLGLSGKSFQMSGHTYRPQLFVGYDSFKEIARFPVKGLGTFNIHRWTHSGRRVTDWNLKILHYDLMNPQMIIDKFQKRDVRGAYSGTSLRNLIALLARERRKAAIDEILFRLSIDLQCYRFKFFKLLGWFFVR